MTGETGALEYDGLILDTGELGPDGLSPMSAFPALLTAAKSGFLTACAMEEREGEELLRVTCGAPDAAPGEGGGDGAVVPPGHPRADRRRDLGRGPAGHLLPVQKFPGNRADHCFTPGAGCGKVR